MCARHDQSVPDEQVLGAAAAKYRALEEPHHEVQVDVFYRRLGTDAPLVPHPLVGFLACVNYFLRLPHNTIAYTVRKAVGLNHHSLGSNGHLQDEYFAAIERQASDMGTQPVPRHAKQIGHSLSRVSVPCGRAVILDAQEERSAVRVGEGRHIFCYEVPCLAPIESTPRI